MLIWQNINWSSNYSFIIHIFFLKHLLCWHVLFQQQAVDKLGLYIPKHGLLVGRSFCRGGFVGEATARHENAQWWFSIRTISIDDVIYGSAKSKQAILMAVQLHSPRFHCGTTQTHQHHSILQSFLLMCHGQELWSILSVNHKAESSQFLAKMFFPYTGERVSLRISTPRMSTPKYQPPKCQLDQNVILIKTFCLWSSLTGYAPTL